MRIILSILLLLSLSSNAAISEPKEYAGNWLLVNGILVIHLSEDGTMTLRNTGVSAKAEFSDDDSFSWQLPDDAKLTGRFEGQTMYLKNAQANVPTWLEHLEFRQADEKVVTEVIEIALQQQSAALASMAKLRESSIQRAVLNNLRQLAAAADQYYLENGTNETSLDQLVGPDKYIMQLESVDGERYNELKFHLDAGEWKVVTASGVIVTYPR
jgi:hypothetical protein